MNFELLIFTWKGWHLMLALFASSIELALPLTKSFFCTYHQTQKETQKFKLPVLCMVNIPEKCKTENIKPRLHCSCLIARNCSSTYL